MSPIVLNAVRSGFYLDSVALMRLSREIAAMPEMQDAALMMATPANKRILEDAGLLTSEGASATANDLIFAVRAHSTDAASAALSAASSALEKPRAAARGVANKHWHTVRAALREQPGSTLALISVPGEYATGEARKALRSGLDVMIFSDNVPLEEEIALKREAEAMGRLVMGPDCGTAIIDGIPLAFANRVPRGSIGVIGASGTGIQEVTCLIARSGKGISHAIGVGGRDLTSEVGGLSTLAAIDQLDADPTTQCIVLISKPPHPAVASAVLARVGLSRKKFTICFLGTTEMKLPANACIVPTLRAAAEHAIGMAIEPAREAAPNLASKPGAILGLYSGGTLAAEAQLILLSAGRAVASNAAVPRAKALGHAAVGTDRIIDLGADEFTRGRPHPMIDPAIRTDKLRGALADMDLGVDIARRGDRPRCTRRSGQPSRFRHFRRTAKAATCRCFCHWHRSRPPGALAPDRHAGGCGRASRRIQCRCCRIVVGTHAALGENDMSLTSWPSKPDSFSRVTHAILVGSVAARSANTDARGTVRAVFDRSFYVTLDAGLICVGPESMGAGPLNLICAPWFDDLSLRTVLQPGDFAIVENARFHAGPVSISLERAQRWHPPPVGPWSRSSLARGLAAFADTLPRQLPSEGLARLLRPTGPIDRPSPVLAAAEAPIRHLLETINSMDADDIDCDQIEPLIGLGPGLTPSGDDYLGGLLIALSLIGRTCLRDQLWQALEPLLARRTGDISRAHLAAAAAGLGNSALHAVLCAILAGRTDAISVAFTSITGLGHTSGWDTLAGSVAGLRAARKTGHIS